MRSSAVRLVAASAAALTLLVAAAVLVVVARQAEPRSLVTVVPSAATVKVCVTARGVVVGATRAGRCPAGARLTTVARRGPRGVRGPAGPAGPAGPPGPTPPPEESPVIDGGTP